ncbi:MAG: ABC transporter permease [Lachnospiraceae bacterium]|nr:ABC transporter permease [Ruminococcus sp.]MCM1273964.1 ABC transporter permease [Lachnospiraceae bacterium]
MFRLLRANFARLWKTKSFWVCFILSVALSAANFFESYSVQKESIQRLGAQIMSNGSNVMLFAAIFAALYLGTDYSNGTIRNKLIIGHKRLDIYLSNLTTAAAGALMMLAASWLTVSTAGLCLGGKLGMPADELALQMLICIAAIAAVSAVFTLIGMLITSKSSITTITLVLTFALILGSAVIMSLLGEPEYVSGYEISADGQVSQSEPQPNPLYVSGAKRVVMTALNDILPSGQILQLETGDVHTPEILPLYSLGVLAVSTGAGLLAFRRKDLK